MAPLVPDDRGTVVATARRQHKTRGRDAQDRSLEQPQGVRPSRFAEYINNHPPYRAAAYIFDGVARLTVPAAISLYAFRLAPLKVTGSTGSRDFR